MLRGGELPGDPPPQPSVRPGVLRGGGAEGVRELHEECAQGGGGPGAASGGEGGYCTNTPPSFMIRIGDTIRVSQSYNKGCLFLINNCLSSVQYIMK